MLDKVLQSASLQALAQELKECPSFLIEHLWDAPKAILSLLIQKVTGKNVCILSGKKDDRFLDNFLFLQGKEVLDLPPRELLSSETLPYSPDLLGKRLETLYLLAQNKDPQIIHCEVGAFLQKTLPPETLLSVCCHWKKGQELPFQELPAKLQELGYQRKPIASDKGEFAVRGGIIDIFPIASSDPFRIDFFGDQIDSIRVYDPIGQKSIRKVDEIFLCPASELDLLQKQEKNLTTLLAS
jgi:transcription-repair coupling factor (superfamily II helicase)